MITIIVPIYNSERYLHRCISSILDQRYSNFELLLIDDGSIDSSNVICEEYSQKDSRIRVFHKENGGVSSARNMGIENARGEWIIFVDSDDFLPNDALLNLSQKKTSDLIVGGYKNHSEDNLICLKWDKDVVENEELSNFLSQNINASLLRVPWCKLFKKELIDKESLRFNCSLVFGEDTVFVLSYLLSCKSISVCNQYCYNYYNIGDSYINKYKEHSISIFSYYKEITRIYNKLDVLYSLSGPKIVYGFIFDILKKNYDEGKISTHLFASFLIEPYVIEALSIRGSIHIKTLLFLARNSEIGLYIYNKIVNTFR